MKILKPGKDEMRKFVCPRCGCEFAAGRGEQDTRYQFHYKCPQDGCGWYVLDTGGEPYEEPTPLPDDRVKERLMEITDEWDRFHFGGHEACVDFLMGKGVTFRD